MKTKTDKTAKRWFSPELLRAVFRFSTTAVYLFLICYYYATRFCKKFIKTGWNGTILRFCTHTEYCALPYVSSEKKKENHRLDIIKTNQLNCSVSYWHFLLLLIFFSKLSSFFRLNSSLYYLFTSWYVSSQQWWYYTIFTWWMVMLWVVSHAKEE